jgi:alkanesulfonate monooxygenase SsuD/methylene tetrahydromethanopterin reductase-like flavin-dependent oxidoreductase (luciferase family)
VSNPDVSHGWYGVPAGQPLGRTREYVEIVRMALRGEPVRHQGRHYQLPPEGSTEAAHLRAAPVRADIPIYLAAVGPRNLELAGEIADGWIGVFSSPQQIAESLAHVEKGRATAGRVGLAGFEVVPSIPVAVGDDPKEAANILRGYFANFMGLGSKEHSVYYALAVRLGYEDAVSRIHDLVQAGDRPGAAAAVPFELMDELSLIGSRERIAGRMAEYARAGVTTLGLTLLAPGTARQLETVEVAAAAWRDIEHVASTR